MTLLSLQCWKSADVLCMGICNHLVYMDDLYERMINRRGRVGSCALAFRSTSKYVYQSVNCENAYRRRLHFGYLDA